MYLVQNKQLKRQLNYITCIRFAALVLQFKFWQKFGKFFYNFGIHSSCLLWKLTRKYDKNEFLQKHSEYIRHCSVIKSLASSTEFFVSWLHKMPKMSGYILYPVPLTINELMLADICKLLLILGRQCGSLVALWLSVQVVCCNSSPGLSSFFLGLGFDG